MIPLMLLSIAFIVYLLALLLFAGVRSQRFRTQISAIDLVNKSCFHNEVVTVEDRYGNPVAKLCTNSSCYEQLPLEFEPADSSIAALENMNDRLQYWIDKETQSEIESWRVEAKAELERIADAKEHEVEYYIVRNEQGRLEWAKCRCYRCQESR